MFPNLGSFCPRRWSVPTTIVIFVENICYASLIEHIIFPILNPQCVHKHICLFLFYLIQISHAIFGLNNLCQID